jgi:glycosyl transferase family 87
VHVTTVSEQEVRTGFTGALRQLRDPLLLAVVPITFALLSIFLGYLNSWPIGFDFRGTLWEPARALLDGGAVYPEPTREAVVIGNPTVYPPLFILASIPLALLPVGFASWLWFCLLGVGVLASLRILGVTDWRCYVLAVTSPAVVHGLFYGNLTVLLVLPLALAWRYRDRARVAGLAVGVAVAAKLFVWPLVVWLLLTRRFRAAAWAAGSAAALVLGAWALIGFEGLVDYPSLLRAVQDVYAIRSLSLSTVAGGLGASVSVAVVVAGVAGLALLGVAAWLVRRPDGDRRAFAVVVAACVIASPIVWPNYAALLFVPIAVTWPRLSAAWFFGYVAWVVGAIAPRPEVSEVCCRPPSVPEQAWAWSHTEPVLWYAAGTMLVVGGVALALAMVVHHRSELDGTATAR